MAVRLVKVDGTDFYFDTQAGAFSLTGEANDTSLTYRWKVKGNYFHYLDNNDAERRLLGTLTGNTRSKGSIKIGTAVLYYGDYSDNERYLPTAVTDFYFYLFLTVETDGVLYLGLMNQAKTQSKVFKSTDYGDSWASVLDQDDFGGDEHLPLSVWPVSDGYLCAVWDVSDIPLGFRIHKASTLDGEWSVVYGGDGYDMIHRGFPDFWDNGTSHIWASGFKGAIGVTPRCIVHRSTNNGDTWGYIEVVTTGINPGQIRVNASSRGFLGCAATGWPTANRYTDDPTYSWTALNVGGGAYRFGVEWPYVVFPQNTEYQYSSDNGETFSTTAIPEDMQTEDTDYYSTAIDMSPHDRNRILAAPPYADKGIWLSTNFGSDWSQVSEVDLGDSVSTRMFGVRFDPFDSDVAYAWGTSGFYRSDDSGATWTLKVSGIAI